MADWPRENIPDADQLFYRVHKSYGTLGPHVFVERNGGMSTDWERYSTAAEAHGRSKVPADNGIVALIAGVVRSVDGLSVTHTPINETNRAHADVKGIGTKGPEMTTRRLLLFKAANPTWLIPV